MRTFRAELALGHPIEEVFGWHERPGAVARMLPPWEPVRLEQEAPDLTEGSEAVFRLAGPPRLTALAPHWVARHTGYRPPYEFVDEQVAGPFREWVHRHHFESAPDGGTRMTDEIGYRLPLGALGRYADGLVASRLRRMFGYRHRQLVADLAAHRRAGKRRYTVAVTGGSGLIGSALAAFLASGGHRVVRLVRRPPRVPDETGWDPARGVIDPEALREADAVVHLAGAGLGGRFSDAHKRAVRDSRLAGTTLLAETLAELAGTGSGPRVLISGSAIGYYGAGHGAELLTETAGPGTDFLATLCRDWEDATRPARQAGLRVVHVRTGVVQSPAGGTMRIQLPLFRAGLGGRLGSGRQWLSWISIDDMVGLLHHALIHGTIEGPLNAVAPQPVTNAEYTRTLGRVLRRPTALPTPPVGPRLLLGREGVELTALASQRVIPARALDTGYEFRHPDLESALRHLLGRYPSD